MDIKKVHKIGAQKGISCHNMEKEFHMENEEIKLWRLSAMLCDRFGVPKKTYIYAPQGVLDRHASRYPNKFMKDVREWGAALRNQAFFTKRAVDGVFCVACPFVDDDGVIACYVFRMRKDDGRVYLATEPYRETLVNSLCSFDWADAKSAYRKWSGH